MFLVLGLPSLNLKFLVEVEGRGGAGEARTPGGAGRAIEVEGGVGGITSST